MNKERIDKNKGNSLISTIIKFLIDNMVTIFFIALSLIAFWIAEQDLTYFGRELIGRFANNAFLVLALIIPILTGLGLNFSIVLGAMAGQLGIYVAVNKGVTGILGITIAALIGSLLSLPLGFLTGKLFNKMKGTETVGGMVLGFFADGVYQFIFLIVIGGLIKVQNKRLLIGGKAGVLNSIELSGTIKHAIDKLPLIKVIDPLFFIIVPVISIGLLIALIYNLGVKKRPLTNYKGYVKVLVGTVIVYALSYIPYVEQAISAPKMPLYFVVDVIVMVLIGYNAIKIILAKLGKVKDNKTIKDRLITIIIAAIVYGTTFIPQVEKMVLTLTVPTVTILVIGVGCLFNSWVMSTRLGQNMRTVGQNRVVANAAGIKVDKTRIIAIILSTIMAAIGQIIFLQGLGTFNTYGAHTDVGFNAVASLLVGGATVNMATSRQAVLGVLLFHSLAILSPKAAKVIFGDAQIGEYFRAFLTFAVIALSLAMYAYGNNKKAKQVRS